MSANLTVEEFTTPNPIAVKAGTKYTEILKLMKENTIRHLIVKENDKIVGLISQRDLNKVSDVTKKTCAKDFMTENVFSVTKDSSLQSVAYEMSQRKIGSAVVLNSKGQIFGIFTSTDALNALTEVLRGEFEEEPSNNKTKPLQLGFIE